MKTILIFTDSVALPKGTGTSKWNQTYISKLNESYKNHEIINISIGGASIKDLRNQVNYYKILSPEIVILQCGIVDAAPRAFGKIEMEIIKKLKLFRLTKYFVPFLRKYRAHHYSSPVLFKKQLIEMKEQLKADRFISIGIIPAVPEYEDVLPGISKSISTYNKILESNTEFISLEKFTADMILPDHHHINYKGQEFIYNLISTKIKKANNFEG